MTRTQLFIFRPTLGQGGADRNTLILMEQLDRELFTLSLVLMRKEGELIGDIPADVRVHELHARSLWTAWWPLLRLLRRHRPAVLLSTSSGANLAAALAHTLVFAPGRLVLSERNLVGHGERTLKRRLQTQLKRVLYRFADSVTVVSEGLKRDVVENLGVREERIAVVYNPVVDAHLRQASVQPVAHPWFAQDVPVVLAVGRLVPQKDYKTLLRACKIVRAQRRVRLLVLGEGPLRPELLALARELGLGDDEVAFPGFDKNPFRYMSRCAVFVSSSLHEGLAGSLIQAMACGAAVVATDCPHGPREIITEPGRDGILTAVADEVALAGHIGALLDDPAARRSMGERARASAERFAAPAITKRYTAAILGPLTGAAPSHAGAGARAGGVS